MPGLVFLLLHLQPTVKINWLKVREEEDLAMESKDKKISTRLLVPSSFFKSSLLESPRGVRKKNYNSKREDLKEEDQ